MTNSIQTKGNVNILDTQLCTCSASNKGNVTALSSDTFDSVLNNLYKAEENNYPLTGYRISNVPMGIVDSLYSESLKLKNNYISSVNSTIQGANSVEISNSNLSEKEKIEDAVKKASVKYGVDANLIKAVIKTESNFKTTVVSKAGAKGLMQIMPSNFSKLGITNPFDIYQNVDGGTKLLKEFIDKYDGDVQMALMAYNGGPTRMKNRGVTSIEHIYKMPKETQNYVKKVMNYYKGV